MLEVQEIKVMLDCQTVCGFLLPITTLSIMQYSAFREASAAHCSISEQGYNLHQQNTTIRKYMPDLFMNGSQLCFFLLFCLHPVHLSCFSWSYCASKPANSLFADILAVQSHTMQ